MREREQHLVTAHHPAPSFEDFTDEPITTDSDPCGGFYASHPRLGCGKTYATRHDAIRLLLRDHAYSVRNIIDSAQRITKEMSANGGEGI